MQKDMPKLAAAIKNSNLPDVKLNSADDIKKAFDNIEDYAINKTSGQIESVTIKNDGDTISLKFDEKGNLITGDSIRSYEVNGEIVEEFLGDYTSKLDELKKAGMMGDIDIKTNIPESAQMNNALKSDIDKLYTAYRKGLDVKDAFVPAFENVDDAIAKLNTGDTCRILGSENIGIKLSDGTIKELNLSADKYLELFPPVEKYAIQQGNIGDCYLVSSLYNLESNPATKAKILECFTQNPDGSIEVKLPGSKSSVNIEAGKQVTDYAKQVDLANSCEGIKALEYAYGVDLHLEEAQKLQSSLTEELDILNNKNEIIDFWESFNNKTNITAEEYETAMETYKKISKLPDDFAESDIKSVLKENNGSYSLDKSRLEGILDYEYDTQKNIQIYLDNINNNIEKFAATAERDLRGSGGQSHKVFEMFGLKSGCIDNIEGGLNALTNPDGWDKHIFSIGTKGSSDKKFLNENLRIAQNHAYSVEPFQSETGEILFKVTNPWNTTNANILTVEQMREYANVVYWAEIH